MYNIDIKFLKKQPTNNLIYGFIGVVNIIFLSLISISLYSLLCRIDLSILFSKSENLSNLVCFFFYDTYISKSTLNQYCTSSFFCSRNEVSQSLSLNYCLFSNVISWTFSYVYLESLSVVEQLDFAYSYYRAVIEVKFFTKVQSFHHIDFFCLQDNVFITSNDTTLVFFRILTDTNIDLSCIIIFLVSPSNLMPILTKLQCFCFDNLFFSCKETLDLPVIFNVDFDSILFLNNKINLLFFYLLLEK